MTLIVCKDSSRNDLLCVECDVKLNSLVSFVDCCQLFVRVKQVEDEMLRRQIEQYNETVSLGRYQQYQQQQQQQHEELLDVQRRRSAPTDVVQALLDISSLPSSSVQLQTHPSHWITTHLSLSLASHRSLLLLLLLPIIVMGDTHFCDKTYVIILQYCNLQCLRTVRSSCPICA